MKKMTNIEEKMLKRIVEKCQMIEENCGIEKAWDYLIDIIYNMSATHTTEFFNKLWDLDEKYKENFVEENTL